MGYYIDLTHIAQQILNIYTISLIGFARKGQETCKISEDLAADKSVGNKMM